MHPQVTQGFQLSPQQERLWYLREGLACQGVGASPYRSFCALRIGGRLGPAALKSAIATVLGRHESLRTTLRWVAGSNVALQVVAAEPASVPWTLGDLTGLAAGKRQEALGAVLEQARRAAFDDRDGPLWATAVLRLAPSTHVVVLVFSGLAADRASLDNLALELGRACGAGAKSRAKSGEVFPYTLFAEWQNELLSSAEAEAGKAHWAKPELWDVLHTPLAFERHADAAAFAPEVVSRPVSPAVAAQLRCRAAEGGSSLETFLLACWQVALWRFAGCSAFVVGVPFDGRTDEELSEAVGLFVKYLPIRCDLDHESSFPDLLAALDRAKELARTWQECFAWSTAAQQVGNGDGGPFYSFCFEVDRAAAPLVDGDLELELHRSYTCLERFRIKLIHVLGDECDATEIHYDSSRISTRDAGYVAECYHAVLASALGNPGTAVGELDALGAAGRRRWSELNDTDLDVGPARCLHELFERQARQTPERVAAACGGDGRPDEQLTYAELDRRADRLACHLRRRGADREACVALRMERSLELVVGLLGVLKSGAAYLPLDPEQPPARTAAILEEARPAVLLTGRGPGAEAGVPVLRLDEPEDEAGRGERRRPDEPALCPPIPHEGAVDEGHPAYVMYTSGSSGRPKGVVVTHGAVVNHMVWMLRDLPLGASDLVLQRTPFSFDASVWEFFAPLSSGARLFVARPDTQLDPDYVARVVREREVTVLQAVPSLLRELLNRQGLVSCPSLRRLCTGGEALSADLQELVFSQLDVELVNLYGPTETCIEATCWRCRRRREVALGAPISNVRLRLLDPRMYPVPCGAVGEIYISGRGLARGYLGRAALTAERFLPQPSDPAPGARTYRTGDLARYHASGRIEFLGRGDHQVKVRGFRVELGEVEAALRAHPGVREAVAVWRGEGGLVGYVVAGRHESPDVPGARLLGDGSEPSSGELRGFLAEKLPGYMVPSVLVALRALPRTPGGKLDRKSLPDPRELRVAGAGHVAPRNELERVLARLWCKALGLDEVGVDDNFFDLGGHSLLLLSVHGELQELLGRRITIVELLEHPTISTLASHLSGRQAPAAVSRAVRQSGAGSTDIAIIGMAGRFPGGADLSEWWEGLRNGAESISFFSDEELAAAGVDSDTFRQPDYVRAGAVLEGIELFDAPFFGYSPREAALIDPQQRIFLEHAWSVLESAGYDAPAYAGRIGVYAGLGTNDYLRSAGSRRELMSTMAGFQALVSNERDSLPARTSYKLNLRGPSVNVQTACSTSLVAVHMAVRSLLGGECEMALAGGVSICVPQRVGHRYQDGGIGSPDGHCRPFDARAPGTVRGNGVGVVLLKRLADALADGDPIHALVKGSAVNNDGALKLGYTAPSVEGQAQVISQALAEAGVPADSIRYVEAHGTGTALGDPIEVEALTKAFRETTRERGFCALGSVKGNIGHLDAAAGIAGLLKTVMALREGVIPPSLHFEQPNPEIDFGASPFFVNTRLSPWPAGDSPRRAGVSSFGIGGTNAHVIVEQAPAEPPSGPARPWHLLVLSAKTPAALEEATDRLARRLADGREELRLADVAFTLSHGRHGFRERRIVVGRECGEVAEWLSRRSRPHVLTASVPAESRPIVFSFSGEGSRYLDRVAEIYGCEPTFREHVDSCSRYLEERSARQMRAVLHPEDGDRPAAVRIQDARSATFVVSYALAKQWMAWGVRPQVMIAQGVGEYVAACLDGELTVEEALRRLASEATEPVFREGLRDLKAESEPIFLELGPGPTPARLTAPHGKAAMVVSSWPRRRNLPSGQAPSGQAHLLTALGRLWAAGAPVDWAAFYARERRRRLPLPTYPFERRRYWLDPEPSQGAAATVAASAEVADWFYLPTWKRHAVAPGVSEGRRPVSAWLLFVDDVGVGSALAERLRREGHQVVTVQAGALFSRHGAGEYTIDPRRDGDYERLLGALDGVPEEVVHLWSVTPPEQGCAFDRAERAQELGLYSLVYLAQALGRGAEAVTITVVSSDLHEVTGEEELRAENATLLGACKTISLEYSNLECKNVDLSRTATGRRSSLVESLWCELHRTSRDRVVAWRGGYRWTPAFEPARLGPVDGEPRLRKKGVYLITGGLGGMGLVLAGYLASAFGATVVLISRSDFPSRRDWDGWIELRGDDDPTSRKIRKLQAMEARGGRALLFQADVADRERMRRVTREVAQRVGQIHGVVHCAGVADYGGVIQRRRRESLDEILDAKLRGTLVLDECLRDVRLDFFVLCSSLGTVLSYWKFGQVGYCAANEFLDAFAYQRSARGGLTLSINWNDWREVGMAVEAERRWARRSNLDEGGVIHHDKLSPAEGVEVFQRILHHGFTRVAVSRQDLAALAREGAQLTASEFATTISEGPVSSESPPVPASGPPEQHLASIWRELLGVDEVDPRDDFFAMGGDSLFAVQMIDRVRRDLHVELTLQSVFESPTFEELARKIAGLDHRQDTGEVTLAAIVPDCDRRHEPFPLTEMQQAYSIGRTGVVELGNVAMHIYSEFESRDLDLGRFEVAWKRLVERHDMLRAIVPCEGRQQILASVPDYEIAVTDLRDRGPELAETELARARDTMSHQVFELRQWPLFEIRASLLPGGRTRLHISLDSIGVDGWSYQILLQELLALYADPEAFRDEPLELSFRDYVLAVRAMERTPRFQASLDYWRGRLAELAPAPELPLAKDPMAVAAPRFHRLKFHFGTENWTRLKTRAGHLGLTPAALLLAAYARALARWCPSSRFTLNVPHFNRQPLHPQVNDILGTFSSFTLVEVAGARRSGFLRLAKRVQGQLSEGLSHQHVAGVRLIRELARIRGDYSGVLMPVVFTSLPSDIEELRCPGLRLNNVYTVSQTPQVWLDNQVSSAADGSLNVAWDFVAELFPQGMIEAMFEVYCSLLERLSLEEGAWEARGVEILAQAHRRLPEPVSGEVSADPLPQTMFAERVAQCPDAIALVVYGRRLSYLQLSEAAHRLACCLRRHGAGRGDLVAVCTEQGWQQVAAVLGVVSSGAAYLPIDPKVPTARLDELLADGKVRHLVAETALGELGLPSAVRRLDVDGAEVARERSAALAPVQEPDELACVMYTSGSTGAPKGVMITHCGVANAVRWTNRRFGVGPGDRALALTTFDHDMSVYDVFGVLAAGGTLILPAGGERRDPALWSQLIRRERVSIWNSVPATMEMWLAHTEGHGAPAFVSLRLVLLGGDWISLSLPERLRTTAPNAELISVGGPTETSVWSIFYPVGEVQAGWKSIPYGRPIANTHYYVLDEALDPCPVWVPGLLYCAGPGVARGYWGDPRGTAEKFPAHPVTRQRLCNTGDVGRLLPDGDIELLGRADLQVKIRGHRIEPGEIEGALSGHGAVRAAAVVVSGEASAKRLVAYVVARDGDVPVSELKVYLEQRLPAHAVPASYVRLDALPLTRNGKVDRRLLARSAPVSTSPQPVGRSPATDAERRVAELLGEVLEIDSVGRDNNLFELGANSVHIVQIHNEILGRWNLDVPVVEIFRHPTVRFLARRLAEVPGEEASKHLSARQKVRQARKESRSRPRRRRRARGLNETDAAGPSPA